MEIYGDKEFSYRDWTPVFHMGKVAHLKDTYDGEAIKNSLRNIFLVQKNTCPGKPWFGNPLRKDIFDLFDNTTERTMTAAIANTVAIYEPRVALNDITVEMLPQYNRIVVSLYYTYTYDGNVLEDNIMLPYTFNTHTFLDGRSQTALDNKYIKGT